MGHLSNAFGIWVTVWVIACCSMHVICKYWVPKTCVLCRFHRWM